VSRKSREPGMGAASMGDRRCLRIPEGSASQRGGSECSQTPRSIGLST